MNRFVFDRGRWFGRALRLGSATIALLLAGACTTDLDDDFSDDPVAVDDEPEGGTDDSTDDDSPLPDDTTDDSQDDPATDDDADDPATDDVPDDSTDDPAVDDSTTDDVTDDSSSDPDAGSDDVMPDDAPDDAPDDEVPDDDVTDDDVTDDTPLPGDAGDAGGGDAGVEFSLIASIPANGSTDVQPDQDLVLEFDRAVRPVSGAITLIESLSGAVVEEVSILDMAKVEFDGSVVTVDWATTLARSTSYAVVLDSGAIEDLEGTRFAGLRSVGELVFSTIPPDALALSSTMPENADVDVPLDTNIVLTFNAPVSAGQSGSLHVIDAADLEVVQSALIGDTTVVTITDDVVSVDLPENLAYSTDYFVTLDADAVQSAQGAPYAGFSDDSVLAFTTVAPPALLLTATTPMDDAASVDPDTPLVFTFNEVVLPGTGSISVFETNGDALVEEIDVLNPAVAISNATVTVDLATTLQYSTEHYVTVDPGALVSLLGAEYAGLTSSTEFSFTTAAAPPEPLLLDSTVPSAGAVDVPVGTNLAFTFSEDIVLGSGNISIYEEDGSLFEVISVNSAQLMVSGATANVNPVGTFDGSTTYYVLISAGSFESAASGASYAGISDAMALSFTTEVSFSLVSLSPPDGATAVSPATDLVLTFNDDVEAGAGNIAVYRSAGNVLLESVPVGDARVSVAGPALTVDLDGLLDGSTAYHVLVDAGAITQAGGGGEYDGTSTATQWDFSTSAVSRPGNVSAGLVLWLDADYDESIKVATGVRYWADRSGQRNDVSSATSAERPSLVASGINGLGSLRFDGMNDWLGGQAGLNLTAAEGFIVWQSSVAASTSAKRSLFLNGANMEVNHGHPGGADASVAACTTPPCNTTWPSVRFSPAPKTNTRTLWNFGFDTVTTSLFASVQGGSTSFQSGPTTAPVAPETPFAIGGDQVGCANLGGCPFQGDIGEVVLYSRRLTQSERLAVIAYLRSKWAIPQVSCSAGEVLGSNGNCYLLSTSFITWDAARSACTGRGAGWDLATVRSQLDHDALVGIMTANGSVNDVWIGASDAEVPDTWRWVSDTMQFWSGGTAGSGGTSVNGSFTAWRTNDPSQGSSEACARYTRDNNNWVWADVGCGDSYAYMCQGPGD